MRIPKLLLQICVLGLVPPSAAAMSAADSAALQEIADSLKVKFKTLAPTLENGRVTRLSLYYGGETGAIPAALGRLDSLHEIHVAITQITRLPKEIGLLTRMDTIDIGSSRIGPTIPPEIADLPNLRVLRVYSCELKALPASLMGLHKLERLDFSHNRICSIPDTLRQWILSISPNALDEQDLSACAATAIGMGKNRKGRTPPAKLRRKRLSVPGASPGPRTEERIPDEVYNPLGRRLGTIRAADPGNGKDAAE